MKCAAVLIVVLLGAWEFSSGRLIKPAAQRMYVQWPELATRRRGLRFAGNLFAGR